MEFNEMENTYIYFNEGLKREVNEQFQNLISFSEYDLEMKEDSTELHNNSLNINTGISESKESTDFNVEKTKPSGKSIGKRRKEKSKRSKAAKRKEKERNKLMREVEGAADCLMEIESTGQANIGYESHKNIVSSREEEYYSTLDFLTYDLSALENHFELQERRYLSNYNKVAGAANYTIDAVSAASALCSGKRLQWMKRRSFPSTQHWKLPYVERICPDSTFLDPDICELMYES